MLRPMRPLSSHLATARRAGLDQSDRSSSRHRRRGNLEPDEAAADYDHLAPSPMIRRIANASAYVRSAPSLLPGATGTFNSRGQAPVAESSRSEASCAPVQKCDGVCRSIYPLDVQPFEIIDSNSARRSEVTRSSGPGFISSTRSAFGQRRSLIWQHSFVSDQDDWTRQPPSREAIAAAVPA